MNSISIYRNGVFFVDIKPDNNSSQVKKIMGENQCSISFDDSRLIPFQINDYCDIFGERYQLNKKPTIKKQSKFLYSYSLVFQAQGFDLAKANYHFLGSDNTLRESDFSLMGTADTFIDLLIQNVNRVSSGWTKGQVIPTTYKNLTFTGENCYNALSRLAEEFETEFSIEGKTIHLTQRSNDTGLEFKLGRNKGLYEINVIEADNADLVTRLYAYGSEKNLPPDYLYKRLRFPGGYNPCLISNLTCTVEVNLDATKTYTFSWTAPLSAGVTDVAIEYRLTGTNDTWQNQFGTPTTPRSITLPDDDYEFRFRTYGSTCYVYTPGFGVPTEVLVITASITSPVFVYVPLPYVERNVAKYGVIEHTVIFDDIFPQRTGTVTGVNAVDEFEFTDADIDFNVNDYLLPGATAKATFNTGQLAGYTFDLQWFNNSTKKFRLQKNAEERSIDVPSTLLRPAIGDKYVLTDIQMPTSYITAAETELQNKAIALLATISEPQEKYAVELDPLYLKRNNLSINIGDLVWISDDEMEIKRKIRVTSLVRNITEEFTYRIELSDTVSPGTIQRLVNTQSSTNRDVQIINSNLTNNSILNNRVIGTLEFSNMPETASMTGFLEVVIEIATGKLYKKV